MSKKIWGVLILLALTTLAQAAPVDKNKAKKAFRGWIRSGTTRMGVDLGGKDITDTQTYTDSSGTALFHVISFVQGGYIVISAEDTIEPIIAFSDMSQFPTDTDDGFFQTLYEDLSSRIQTSVQSQQQEFSQRHLPESEHEQFEKQRKHFREKSTYWSRLLEEADVTDFDIEMDASSVEAASSSISDVRVNPLVSTRWNQNSPENKYTPNANNSSFSWPCGCVATAMAQLMRYHQHPVIGIGARTNTIQVDGVSQSASTRGGDGLGGPYDWAGMPNSPSSSDYAVGALCYDAGVSVGMKYTSSVGSVDTLNSDGAFTGWFKYARSASFSSGSTASGTLIQNAINTNLDAMYPVVLGIRGGDAGHAVVCDGYGFDNSTPFHHLNMGWGGSQDAWYNLPNIDTGIFYSNFDRVYKVIYNVFPSETGEIVSGRVMDSEGQPVNGINVQAADGLHIYDATTNDKGIFAFAHIPTGSYRVSVLDPDLTSSALDVTVGTSTYYDNGNQCGNIWGIELTLSDYILKSNIDAFVDSSTPDDNFGSDLNLAVVNDGAGNIAESFIKFDLSSISSTVDTAQLRLQIDENSAARTSHLYVLSDDSWQENTITYNNRPVGGFLIATIHPTVIQTTSETVTLIGPTLEQGNGGFEYYNPDDYSSMTSPLAYVGVDPGSSMTPVGATDAPRVYLNGYADVTYPGWIINSGGSNNSGIDYRFVMYPDTSPLSGDIDGDGMDAYVYGNGRIRIKSEPVDYAVTAGDIFNIAFDFRTRNPNSSPVMIESVSLFFGSNQVIVSSSTYPSGTDTAMTFDFAYQATEADASANSVSVYLSIADVTEQTLLDNVSLTVTPGVYHADRELNIDVSAAVIREMQGDKTLTFCLRGDENLIQYNSDESGNGPTLLISEDTQADSSGQWDADSSQPDEQWSYGYYPVGADDSAFVACSLRTNYYAGPQSWIGGGGEIWDHPEGYPRMGKYSISPYGTTGDHTADTTSRYEAVRRWTSDVDGVITITHDLQQIQNSADGQIARIRKNGALIWSQNMNDVYRSSKSFELSVNQGDVVDFAVDPVDNHSADWMYWRIRITTEPQTANQAKLVAYYDMDEASDMPTDADGDMYDRKMFAYDYSGNNNHATLKNADTWTVWADGLIGNAVNLDGVNDYIQVPAVINPANGPMSIFLWAKGGQSGQSFVSQQDADGVGRHWIRIDPAGQFGTNLMQSGGNTLYTTSLAWDATQWHHVGLVWDGTRRHLYLDGEIIIEDMSDQTSLESSNGLIYLGCDKILGSNWSGAIDDAGIWARALTDNEVWSMYHSGLSGRNLAHVKNYTIETDLDGNGKVDLGDFAVLSEKWLDQTCSKYNFNCQGADIFQDEFVDSIDLQFLMETWLETVE